MIAVDDGIGPLKSMLSLSQLCVALMSFADSGLKNCGLHSQQILQALFTFRISYSENGKLRLLTKAFILVIPG